MTQSTAPQLLRELSEPASNAAHSLPSTVDVNLLDCCADRINRRGWCLEDPHGLGIVDALHQVYDELFPYAPENRRDTVVHVVHQLETEFGDLDRWRHDAGAQHLTTFEVASKIHHAARSIEQTVRRASADPRVAR